MPDKKGWLIVKKGNDIVIAPNDPRLVEIIELSPKAHKLDEKHPTIFETEAALLEKALQKKYKDKLWPDGDYHILSGGGYVAEGEAYLTSRLLIYMQE